MPFKSLSRGVAVLAIGLSLAGPAAAELSPVERAELSMRLYRLGVEEQNPLSVIAAAQIRKQMSFRRGDAPAKAEGSGLDILPGGHSADPLDWQAMLAVARDLAAGDNVLLEMIEDIAAESSKGVTTGQVYSISEIADGAEDTYDNLPFKAGEYAEVYVESQDGSDLNLYVYDAAGRLVCSDTDVSSISYCGWRPSEGGTFTIKVENRGAGSAGYALMTN